jgi:hypothetical protein
MISSGDAISRQNHQRASARSDRVIPLGAKPVYISKVCERFTASSIKRVLTTSGETMSIE